MQVSGLLKDMNHGGEVLTISVRALYIVWDLEPDQLVHLHLGEEFEALVSYIQLLNLSLIHISEPTRPY